MRFSALPSALIPSATLACSVLFSGTEFAASYQRTAFLCRSKREGFLMMMRKLSLLVLLVVFGGSSGASAVPITNGLVAGYEFSGNADDVSGNGIRFYRMNIYMFI